MANDNNAPRAGGSASIPYVGPNAVESDHKALRRAQRAAQEAGNGSVNPAPTPPQPEVAKVTNSQDGEKVAKSSPQLKNQKEGN